MGGNGRRTFSPTQPTLLVAGSQVPTRSNSSQKLLLSLLLLLVVMFAVMFAVGMVVEARLLKTLVRAMLALVRSGCGWEGVVYK